MQSGEGLRSGGHASIVRAGSRGWHSGYDVIRELESLVFLETGVVVGSKVEHTVDLLTSVGSAILMHSDKEVVRRDVARIRELEKNGMFTLKQTSKMMRAASTLNFQDMSLAK